MIRKKLQGLFVLCALSLSLAGCADKISDAGSAAVNHSAVASTGTSIVESALPDAQWQLDVSFPDWKSSVSSTYAVNNRVGFYGYFGQGRAYLEVSEDAALFSLFINDQTVETDRLKPGRCYAVDISELTVNGLNTIQVSGLDKGSVRVCIPYPVIIEGTPEEVGIQQAALDLIDRIITADVENGFSSAQLAVVKDGRLVFEKAWGNTRTYDEQGNPVKSTPVTKDTLYDLASNTKMYSVNYAVQYLLTNGGIDLDSRIVDILGGGFSEDTIAIDYVGYESVPLETNKAWKEKLTIRDLLLHQGGFPPGPHYYNDRYDNSSFDFDSDNGNVLYVGTAGDMNAREETLMQIFRTPLMYEPGTQTLYSDVDYMVLCYCIEKITGQRLDEFLTEIFWKPTGLAHITYNPLEHGFDREDCAATELMGNSRDGHLRYTGIRRETIQGEVHDPNAYYCMAGISGHAGLFSNASDLARLASVMLTGGYGERRYFSRDVIDLFTAPKSEAYPSFGLGWWREADHRRDHYFGSTAGSTVFGHQGFTGTLTMIDPDHQLVIVLLTNKIHSRLLENDETLSKYKGNYYTTATLGFVPEIIEIGLDSDHVDDGVWKGLLSDMAADAKRQIDAEGITDKDHPAIHAYNALLEAYDSWTQ